MIDMTGCTEILTAVELSNESSPADCFVGSELDIHAGGTHRIIGD